MLNLYKNPTYTAAGDVADICSRYFTQIKLNFFSHLVLKPNGEFYKFISDERVLEYQFIDSKLPPANYVNYNEVQNSVVFPDLTNGHMFALPDKFIIDLKNGFNMKNMMIISQVFDDHIELSYFDIHGARAHEIYMNHLDYFSDFIFYLKDKTIKLRQQLQSKPLRFNKAIDFELPEYNTYPPKVLQSKCPKKYYLYHDHNYISLTPIEYQVLALLSQCSTIKIIAQQLNRSPRTIETHLKHLKTKLNVHSRQQLMQIYFNNKTI